MAALGFSSCGGGTSDHARPASRGPDLAMSKKEVARLPKLTIAKQSGPAPRRLEVTDLRKGSGAVVASGDAVLVRYFEASYSEALEQSQTGLYGPQSFGLNEVVKGWKIGLPGMRVGGRRELILPPKLVFPGWKPSWGYEPYTNIYLIDLLGVERGGAKGANLITN